MKRVLLALCLHTNALPAQPPIFGRPPLSYQQADRGTKMIQIYIEDTPVMQTVGIEKKRKLKVVRPDPESEWKAYVDETEIPLQWQQNTASVEINPENQILEFVSGQDDREIRRRVEIDKVDSPSFFCSVQDGEYTLNNDPAFTFQSVADYLLNWNNLTEETSGSMEAEQANDFVIQNEGEYRFLLQHKKYPYIQYEVAHFFFTDHRPVADIEVTKDQESKGAIVSFKKGSLWVQEAYIEISSSRQNRRIPFTDSFLLEAEEGKDISTHIRLFVQDRFRQTGVAEKEIRLDALAPNMKLICNEEEITGNTVHFDTIRNIDVRPSESASVSIYVQNGKERVPVSDLGRFLNQMRPLQPAMIVFSLLDESGNASEFRYQFHKTVSLIPEVRTIPVQESKKEAVSEETVIPPVVRQNISTSDYQLQQRTYSLDSNNHIVVEKKIVSKVDKPVITVRFFSADDKEVKVLIKKTQNGLKNKVLWIKVNGKKMNLKKIQSDSLGNMIYHIPLKKQKNHIQIKVMNEKGYTKRIEKTIVVQKRTQETDMSLWQRIQSFWIQLKNKIGYV